jgi:hypothetical protein
MRSSVPFLLHLAVVFAAWDGGCFASAVDTQVPAALVDKWNMLGAVQRPDNAEAPGRYSVDHEAHRIAYNFQAPGIAVAPMPGVCGLNRFELV